MRNHETQPGQEGSPDQTQKLVLPLTSDAPQRTQKISLPAGTAGQTQMPRPPTGSSRSWGWKLALAVGGILVLGGAALLLSSRGPVARPAQAFSRTESPLVGTALSRLVQ